MKKDVENSERERILNYFLDKFLKEGFYKTSMDTVAAELRISKKTIYKHFSSKEQIVDIIVTRVTSEVSLRIDKIINGSEDSLTKALLLFEIIGSMAIKFSDKWVNDIRVHRPELWEKVDDFRTRRAYSAIGNIIRQGQKEGMIINKPAELIIHLFVNSIRSIVNPDFQYYHKYNYKEAFQFTFEIIFSGILTPKGKKQFDKIFKKVTK